MSAIHYAALDVERVLESLLDEGQKGMCNVQGVGDATAKLRAHVFVENMGALATLQCAVGKLNTLVRASYIGVMAAASGLVCLKVCNYPGAVGSIWGGQRWPRHSAACQT